MADYSKYINSTGTHWISNSGSDERGKYKGGAAGDQTGKEWQLRSWYNRPWSVVLRYPDPAVGMKIAELGIDAALNNNIGYDQNQRTTYWTQLVKSGYNPSAIKTKCEEDCTAGVTANVKAAGHIFGIKSLEDIRIDTYSGNMRSRFVKAGFEALTSAKYVGSDNYLLSGDILLYEGHHAATNITYGKYAERVPVKDYKLGDRTLERGMSGPDVAELQHDLLALGYSFPEYGADGDFGLETERNVKGFQRVSGVEVDGIFGPASYKALMNALSRYVEITGNLVNVRKGPGVQYAVMGVVKDGDRLPYGGQRSDNGWYLVEYDTQNAWVSGKYGRLVE